MFNPDEAAMLCLYALTGSAVQVFAICLTQMVYWYAFFINLVRMFDGADLRDQRPALSIACCAGPDPTTRSRNSSAMAEFYPKV